MKNYDCLLMPYQESVITYGGHNTAKYMSPMKMFEYMAWGVPILASDLPVLREVLSEKNAFVVDRNKFDAWCDGLKEIVENPRSADARAKSAYENVNKYSWEGRAQSIFELHEKGLPNCP